MTHPGPDKRNHFQQKPSYYYMLMVYKMTVLRSRILKSILMPWFLIPCSVYLLIHSPFLFLHTLPFLPLFSLRYPYNKVFLKPEKPCPRQCIAVLSTYTPVPGGLDLSFSTMMPQFRSVTQSYPSLCDPMDCSTPAFPVHHQLPEFTQTHVHSFGDAIQPSHPLLSPSPPAFNLSQH